MKKTPREPLPPGLFYQFPFVNREERSQILGWLKTLHPLWEMRFSEHFPPPEGDKQRPLLRPVYWLGNWQFACLNYYHPPEGILHRCLRAEPYPHFLKKQVERMEFIARKRFPKNSVPEKWKLNTCLINFYGSKLEEGKWIDRARVGEHKDFEPGPVASMSFGDRAYFQFVAGNSNLGDENAILSQWLEDSSLQIFAGEKWKERYFHRVQRVEDKKKERLGPEISNFSTRRINFTFRYVPEEHIYHLKDLPGPHRQDIAPYLEELGQFSPYYQILNQNKD